MTVAGTLKPYAYLQDLYTLPEYRGMGIAQQLIQQQVNQTAQQRECDRADWLTHEDNLQARQLILSCRKREQVFIQYRSPATAMYKTRMHIFYKFMVSSNATYCFIF